MTVLTFELTPEFVALRERTMAGEPQPGHDARLTRHRDRRWRSISTNFNRVLLRRSKRDDGLEHRR
jgi:hypothetical protein